MIRCLACLGIVSLISCPLCDKGQNIAPPTISYYNLKCRLVKTDTVWNGYDQKKLVLTYSRRKKVVEKAIREYCLIDLPSPPVLDAMHEAYATSDSTHKEHGFFVGKKGNVSKVVEGEEDHLSEVKKEARISLDEKDDIPAYDVHTHPEEPFEGNPAAFGSAYPSTGASSDMDSSNFIDRAEANIVLGYEDRQEHDLGTGDSYRVGSAAQRKLVRAIGFYNAKKCIKTIEFATFEALVDRISKSGIIPSYNPSMLRNFAAAHPN